MAKGYWELTDRPNRPGFYNRFVDAAEKRIAMGQRGILGMPVKSNWGKPREIVSVTSEAKLIAEFGNSMEHTAYRLGRLALLGGAKELKLYRLTDGSEKQATLDLEADGKKVIKLKTKYPTTRAFNVTVEPNIVNEDLVNIYIFEGARQLETLEGVGGSYEDIEKEINNTSKYIIAEALVDEPEGTPDEEETENIVTLDTILNKALEGGNDGTEGIKIDDYIQALTEYEGTKINGIVLDGVTEEPIITSFIGWVTRVRKAGKKVRGYIGGTEEETPEEHFKKSRQINNEAIYRLGGIGAAELDGEWYTPAEAVVFDAAKSEGKKLLESLCNADTIWTDLKVKLSNEQLSESIRAGAAVYRVDDDGVVKIEDDVNTYTRFDVEHGKKWGNVRAIQFIDMVDEDTSDTGNAQYVGKILNSAEKPLGQKVIITGLKGYFETLSIAGVIESDFIVEVDEEKQAQAEGDEFFWYWDAKYIDVTKRLYGTGRIR